MRRSKYFIFILSGLLYFSELLAQSPQVDSSYIQSFSKKNDIEVYSGFTNTVFHFRHLSNDNSFSHHKLIANTRASMGFTFDYKWLSIDYSKSLSGTAIDNRATSIKALGLHFRTRKNNYLIEAGTQKFKGLVLPLKLRQREFENYNNINYRSYSARVIYIFNANKFSLKAAESYSALQLKSAGSFMFGASSLYQRFKLKSDLIGSYEQSDSLFLNAVRKNPKTFNILYNAGYTYNFVFDRGKWSVNPGFFAGAGWQKSISGEEQKHFKGISDFQIYLNAGHNGNLFYYYIRAKYNRLFNHLVSSDMSTRNDALSLTLGYRIGTLKYKIFGLL